MKEFTNGLAVILAILMLFMVVLVFLSSITPQESKYSKFIEDVENITGQMVNWFSLALILTVLLSMLKSYFCGI